MDRGGNYIPACVVMAFSCFFVCYFILNKGMIMVFFCVD